jgi:hypothetical protein
MVIDHKCKYISNKVHVSFQCIYWDINTGWYVIKFSIKLFGLHGFDHVTTWYLYPDRYIKMIPYFLYRWYLLCVINSFHTNRLTHPNFIHIKDVQVTFWKWLNIPPPQDIYNLQLIIKSQHTEDILAVHMNFRSTTHQIEGKENCDTH